jgi:hypothetical protein
VRKGKDCPGGKAKFYIELYKKHYFLGGWCPFPGKDGKKRTNTMLIFDLEDEGLLRTRAVGDMARRRTKVSQEVKAGDYNPDFEIKHWSPLAHTLTDKSVYDDFEFSK